MNKVYYLAAALLLTVSCKTSFRISVKEPAVIKLSDEAKNFGVVNNVTRANSPEEVAGNILSGQTINGNVIAAERAMDGIFRALDNSADLHGITFKSDSLHLANGQVNWSYIDSAAALNKLNGFIEIAELRTVSPIGGTVLANMEGKSSTTLSGTAYVNYYIAKEHVSHERMAVHYKYNIPLSEGSSVIDIFNDVKRKQEYYRALGFELGYKAGKLIYPNWVWASRKFYNKGSRVLKQAKPMIYKGNWDIAEKQLLYDEDHGSNKVRGRVYYNLALVNEGQGEIDEAIKWAERSVLECGNKMANDYLVTLRERKWQMEVLNQE